MSPHPLAATLGVVLIASSSLLPLPWRPHLPAWAERWLYNPRERTERAIDRYRAGEAKEALAPMGTALRQAPADPRVQYDAGTVELAAGNERQAIELLEKAAEHAPPDLAATAHYNLGNARLAGGDAAGAVEAYRQALRLDPADQDAKWNLELALKERERERMRMRSPRQGSKGDRGEEGESSERPGAEDPAEDEQELRSQARDPGESRQGEQGEEGEPRDERRQPGAAGGGERPLPRFEDQPEMSANEAAALLDAVENLERRQRREQAAQRARRMSAEGKDW